jgi:hypothetical protein
MKKRKHPLDKPRPGYEWSLDDDLEARDKSDWALPKPEKNKPKKRKPVAKKKSAAAKPKPASGDAGKKSPNLAAAQARSVAIRKDRVEQRIRDIEQTRKQRRKTAGREAGRKMAITNELVRIAKKQPRVKGKKISLGRTAGRLGAEAMVTIAKHTTEHPHGVTGGTQRQKLRNFGRYVVEEVGFEKSDTRGIKKQRGVKPSSYATSKARAEMVRTRSKRLTGIIPVVATLASGWLSGELNKKGKK